MGSGSGSDGSGSASEGSGSGPDGSGSGSEASGDGPGSDGSGSGSTSSYGNHNTDQKHIYPLPLRLANLLQAGDSFKSVDYKALAHPSFLQRITTEQFTKMFKFGLWAEYMLDTSDDFTTLSDVVKAELDTFNKSGFNLREDFQVKTTYMHTALQIHTTYLVLYFAGANFPPNCSKHKI